MSGRMACTSTDHAALERRLGAIETKLDRLDEAIRGTPANGTRPGILTRLDRLEQTEHGRSRLLWVILGAAGTLAVTAAWQHLFGA